MDEVLAIVLALACGALAYALCNALPYCDPTVLALVEAILLMIVVVAVVSYVLGRAAEAVYGPHTRI